MLSAHEKPAIMCSSVVSECPTRGFPLCTRPAASGVCCTCVVVELGSPGGGAGRQEMKPGHRSVCSTASGAGTALREDPMPLLRAPAEGRCAVHVACLSCRGTTQRAKREGTATKKEQSTFVERQWTSQTRTDSLPAAGQSACAKPRTPRKTRGILFRVGSSMRLALVGRCRS